MALSDDLARHRRLKSANREARDMARSMVGDSVYDAAGKVIEEQRKGKAEVVAALASAVEAMDADVQGIRKGLEALQGVVGELLARPEPAAPDFGPVLKAIAGLEQSTMEIDLGPLEDAIKATAVPERGAVTWRFDVQRDADGYISSITAEPS